MVRFAANISWLFTENAFADRFAAAAASGFSAVECLFPYEDNLAELQREQRNNRQNMVLINAPAGDWDNGERGLASLPERTRDYEHSLSLALEYALAFQCRQIHVMAGNRNESIPYEEQYRTLKERLRRAADYFAPYGIQVLIEPLNNLDMPGYFLNSLSLAAGIIHEVGHDNLRLQFDCYHIQRIQGDIFTGMKDYWPLISHIQIASVPYRNEPDSGELDYRWLFRQWERMNYTGWVGCEYRPLKNVGAQLVWLNTCST